MAAAVSGGADSMCLAMLARDWAAARGGSVLALVVDHGLRPGSAQEARITIARLTALQIPARLLTLMDLVRGPALAERARAARYRALSAACVEARVPHLLLGHHAADQAETVMIRVLGGSGTRGLAGMAALVEANHLRLVRPLLSIRPDVLRADLRRHGIDWVEDPSNTDPGARRPRLRMASAAPDDDATGSICAAAASAGHVRASRDEAVAAELAERVTLRPEGFAVLSPGAVSPEAFGRLLQVIGGRAYPANTERIATLARNPGPATIGGVRLLPAGRLGPGWLVVREQKAIMGPVALAAGAIWDGRYRIVEAAGPHACATISALGDDAARLRRLSSLPSVVLRTLPAVRCGKLLVDVPHLPYDRSANRSRARLIFDPPQPLAGAPFLPTLPIVQVVGMDRGCGRASGTLC
ncbi:MAG: tRNA lysidine(34) synthetase TilS [Acetobacteraceae bacterium]